MAAMAQYSCFGTVRPRCPSSAGKKQQLAPFLIIRLLKQIASSRGADSVFAQHLVLC